MEKMTMLEFGEPVVMAYLQRINLFQSYAAGCRDKVTL